ncbi:hypothetical protein WR25_04402 [Diploscapter pachys]|uniref:Uncharacterized protein n=1 Tax=Diploscapter pachys TaxID=2018661 RepID=A0A2A2JZY4_9BILA|nr:hypothetical protein WR25_04402 [Diploscapter pachys]
MHSSDSFIEQFILLVVFLQTHIFCRYFTSYNAIQKSRSPTTNSLVNPQEESCFQTNAGKLRFDDNFSLLKWKSLYSHGGTGWAFMLLPSNANVFLFAVA